MLRGAFVAASMLALGIGGWPGPSRAQDYPAQPIRLVVPYAPGAGSDLLGRLTAEALTARLGQPVVVENKPGAGGAIGTDLVVKSRPDGYTLLWASSDGVAILPAVKSSLPYKVPDDFSFVARITGFSYFVVVNPKLPINSLSELIAYAKANPGKLRYGSIGIGSGPHMATALIAKSAGIEMVHVPFGGVAPALTAALGGHIDLALGAASSVKPYVDAGTLRALAVTGSERHPLLPAVPTLAESGLPLVVISNWWGLLAPAGTPEPALARLRKATAEMVKDAKTVERLGALGYQFTYLEGAAFKDFAVKDFEQWKAVAKSANVAIAD